MNNFKQGINQVYQMTRLNVFSKVALSISAVFLATACMQKGDATQEQSVASKTKNDVSEQARAAQIWPKLDIVVKKDDAVEQRVESILATMTLEQKIAQMIQPEIRDVTIEEMRQYGFGSYLNGGGAFPNDNKHATAQDWVDLAEKMYQASIDDSLDGSTIPTMWGTDAVHGHNNVIGATLFPHNIGLGAANNPDLIEQIAHATAKEVLATGIDWVFAPTVAVVRDDRWGRTYESYSEDPAIVKDYAAAIVSGLQGKPGDNFLDEKHVISTVKHFVGDGGTVGGDDQGDNVSSEQELFDIHAQGYVGGLTAGSQSVMASFNSWHGDKIHGNKYLLTTVLKDTMGFDGFVVGDWNGHGQIKGCDNSSCPQAINAGLDIFMAPTQSWKPLFKNTLAQVQSGEISQERIDDAVRRILRVKVRAGLFEKPSPKARALAADTSLIGHDAHRAIARDAVRQSLVLLKNNNKVLPLKPNQHVLVAGDGADNIGKQSGGWTITWQGTGNTNDDFPGATSIYDGIKQQIEEIGGSVELNETGDYQNKPDVAVVVFGEEPYAEGNGDLDNLEYQRANKRDHALLKKLQDQGIPVVSVFITGRPLWTNAEINASDAFVVAWLPGSEGVGVADVLVANKKGQPKYDFAGRLSFSWPASPTQATVNLGDADYQPLFKYGYGLTYKSIDQVPVLDETVERSTDEDAKLVLMDRAVQAPFKLRIGHASTPNTPQKVMNSSVLENQTVYVRTIDRFVQEDTRLVRFSGEGVGRVSIGHDFPVDLLTLVEQNATLNFDIKLANSIESGDVFVGMDAVKGCQKECRNGVDLASHIQSDSTEWQSVGIELSCFNTDKAAFAKVFEPLVLTSSQAVTLEFSNVNIAVNDREYSTVVKCN